MLKHLSIAVLAGGLSLSASAGQFRIDTGVDFNADGDSITGAIDELGYSGTLATSYYFGLTPGSTVIDTNIGSILAGTFASGSYATIGGPSASFSNSPLFAQRDIDALTPLTGGLDDTENFNFPNGFRMTYEYMLVGAINATGTAVNFTGGYFNLFLWDTNAGGAPIAGTDRQILQVQVTGSQLDLANQFIFGLVDYGWCAPACSAEVQNFFVDETTGQTFFDIWDSAVPPPQINFTLDTNVNPPVPTLDQLVLIDGSQAGLAADCSALGAPPGTPCLMRQTTLDGSAVFNVPEPGTVALLGAGLLGFGALRKRRRNG